jgi:ABC-2 type transport system ATP-binding protein
VSVARPTLDDVFMAFTGSSIRDAEGERGEQANRMMMQAFAGGRR